VLGNILAALVPHRSIHPEPTGLLETALTIRLVFVEENPNLCDLSVLALDQYGLQRRVVAQIASATKFIAHCLFSFS
jgi:hypothetical protein